MNKTWLIAALLVTLLGFGEASAEDVTCSTAMGACTLAGSSFECSCIDGSGVAGASLDPEGGDTPTTTETDWEPTDANCQAMIADVCGVDLCQSEKGVCIIMGDGSARCTCADGSGEGSSGSSEGGGTEPSEPPEVDPNAETGTKRAVLKEGEAPSCAETLATECPNDPPDPETECGTEAFDACTDSFDFYAGCGYIGTLLPYVIIECCDYYTQNPAAFNEILACIRNAGCDGYADACFEADAVAEGDYAGSPETAHDKAAQESAADGDGTADGDETTNDDESKDDSGCAHSGAPAGFLLLLLGGALSVRRRIFAR